MVLCKLHRYMEQHCKWIVHGTDGLRGKGCAQAPEVAPARSWARFGTELVVSLQETFKSLVLHDASSTVSRNPQMALRKNTRTPSRDVIKPPSHSKTLYVCPQRSIESACGDRKEQSLSKQLSL